MIDRRRFLALGAGAALGVKARKRGRAHVRVITDGMGLMGRAYAIKVGSTGGGAITHGIQLTSGNVGVPAGTTLTNQATSSGDIVSGTYTDKLFQLSGGSWFTVPTGSCTFTRCRFPAWVLFDTGSTVTLDHCDLDGGFSGSTFHSVTMTDCHIYNPGADHAQLTGDSPAGSTCNDWTLTRCLFDGIIPANVAAGVHLDGIQTRGVQRLLLDKCAWRMGDQWLNVDDPLPINAAVFFENANGGSIDVELRDSYLDGGTQVLFLQPFSGYLRVTGCKWGPRFSGERVRNDSAITPSVWSNNTLESDGSTVNY